jgi:hypothetical protein
MESFLVAEFSRALCTEEPEAIQWAFRVWRDTSPFLPAISDIRGLVKTFKKGRREQDELRARLKENVSVEEARKMGQLVEFKDIVHNLVELVKRMPESVYEQRQRDARERASKLPTSPAVELVAATEDQFRKAEERERTEVSRAVAQQQYEEDRR